MLDGKWYRHQCCICGKFCKWDCDSSNSFGSCVDQEPPDAEYYCGKCEKEQEYYYVKQGWVPNDWIKSRWQRRAAQRLEMIEIKLQHAAWTQWHKKDTPLPKDFICIAKELS